MRVVAPQQTDTSTQKSIEINAVSCFCKASAADSHCKVLPALNAQRPNPKSKPLWSWPLTISNDLRCHPYPLSYCKYILFSMEYRNEGGRPQSCAGKGKEISSQHFSPPHFVPHDRDSSASAQSATPIRIQFAFRFRYC